MQVVRMQNFRNISPMSDLGWSRLVCPPLFLPSTGGRENSRKPQTGALPGQDGERGSIIINLMMMEKQESSPRFGRAPEFVFVTARLGPIRRGPHGSTSPSVQNWATDDEPSTSGHEPLVVSKCTLHHVPCRHPD